MPQSTNRVVQAQITRIGDGNGYTIVETTEGTFYLDNRSWSRFSSAIGWDARYSDYSGETITLWIEDDWIVGWA